MKVKYPTDYIDELVAFFPQIPKQELERMISGMSSKMITFMRKGSRGVSLATKYSLAADGSSKKDAFIIQRVYGKKHLESLKRQIKKRNKLREELYGTE